MGCKNCKKKKSGVDSKKQDSKRIINPDKVVTWVIVVWIVLGFYGLFSLISTLVKIIF